MSLNEFNKKHGSLFKTKGRSKYNAKRTTIDNKSFDSTSEGNYYAELKLQERAGLIKGIDCQVKEELWAYGKHICDYKVDFLVYHLDGSLEFIEHKGQPTPDWRIKWKFLLAKYDKEINEGKVKCSINWYKGYSIKQKK